MEREIEMNDDLQAAALAMTEEAEVEQNVTVAELDQKIGEINFLRDQIDAMDHELSQQNKLLKEKLFEIQKILDAMGRTSYTLPGVGTISKVVDNSFKMPQGLEDRAALFGYIEGTYGKDALLGYLSIHHQSLNSFIKTERGNGVYQIPGVGTPTVNEYARFTRARK